MMNKKQKKTKKEYSKIITSFIIFIFVSIAVWSMAEYYSLIRLSIVEQSTNVPDVTLPVTSITTILGAAMSYFIYQGYLKGSLNRNQLIKDEDGLIKSIIDRQQVEEIINNMIDSQVEIQKQENKETRVIGFLDNQEIDE